MLRSFARVSPTPAEVSADLPGDEFVPRPDVVMDRAFTVPALPDQVWTWFLQLGKRRAGWYFPRAVERFIPARRRGLRYLEPGYAGLAAGDVIPDWGGRDATFRVAVVDPPRTLVHRSTRGRTELSWAIVLQPTGSGATRIHLRLRMAPVRRRRIAESAGGFFDLLTVAGLASGLAERVSP